MKIKSYKANLKNYESVFNEKNLQLQLKVFLYPKQKGDPNSQSSMI